MPTGGRCARSAFEPICGSFNYIVNRLRSLPLNALALLFDLSGIEVLKPNNLVRSRRVLDQIVELDVQRRFTARTGH